MKINDELKEKFALKNISMKWNDKHAYVDLKGQKVYLTHWTDKFGSAFIDYNLKQKEFDEIIKLNDEINKFDDDTELKLIQIFKDDPSAIDFKMSIELKKDNDLQLSDLFLTEYIIVNK